VRTHTHTDRHTPLTTRPGGLRRAGNYTLQRHDTNRHAIFQPLQDVQDKFCDLHEGDLPLTGCLHVPIVGPTGRSDPGYVRLSVRPVGQTGRTDYSRTAHINQINVACYS